MRAAERVGVPVCFVASVPIRLLKSPLFQIVQVEKGEQVADLYIKSSAKKGEMAITADIPLAYELVDKGLVVINPRGDLYNRETIGERFSMRNFITGLRDRGVNSAGSKLSKKNSKKSFPQIFDRELTRLVRLYKSQSEEVR